MRLQLPKIHDPENPHKYWVFGPRYSYTVAADATTAKEQPTYSRARKPLILLAFRHFEGFRKNGIPAII